MGFLGRYIESLDYEYEILPTCTHRKNSHSKCQKCVESCEYQAISFVNGYPEINHELCSECGKCITACPVQAVAGIYPFRTIQEKQLIITDKRVPSKKELLVLYGKGIKTISCEDSSLLKLWKETIETANSDLRQLGKEPFIISAQPVSQKEAGYTRRDLFTFWKKESKSVLKLAAPAKWRFNHDDFNVKKYYDDYLFTTISIDMMKCSLCTACQRICEEKVFHIHEDRFIISPASCTSCQLCADVCPDEAIKIIDCITEKSEDTILQIHQNSCIVCNKDFDSLDAENNKCDICTKRELYIK